MTTKNNITKRDVVLAANHLGVEPALVAAIMRVEAGYPRLRGFTSAGTLRLLWERHVCWRNSTPTERARLPRSVCNKAAGGYARTTRENWERLHTAAKVMGRRAWRCASFGLFQILGENHKICGYRTAKGMATAFDKHGEREHLKAFARFVEANKRLHRAMRRKDWKTIAYYYNGPKYARFRYDQKIAKAYEDASKITWPEIKAREQKKEMRSPVERQNRVAAAALAVLAALGGLAAALWDATKEIWQWIW